MWANLGAFPGIIVLILRIIWHEMPVFDLSGLPFA